MHTFSMYKAYGISCWWATNVNGPGHGCIVAPPFGPKGDGDGGREQLTILLTFQKGSNSRLECFFPFLHFLPSVFSTASRVS